MEKKGKKSEERNRKEKGKKRERRENPLHSPR
jgi:hypothetical protein